MDIKKLPTTIKNIIKKSICVVDEILDKASRPLMYFLELIGVIIAIILMIKLISAINLMYNGDIEKGKLIIDSLSIALNATKEIIVSIFVALPAAIGTLKALNKKWKNTN